MARTHFFELVQIEPNSGVEITFTELDIASGLLDEQTPIEVLEQFQLRPRGSRSKNALISLAKTVQSARRAKKPMDFIIHSGITALRVGYNEKPMGQDEFFSLLDTCRFD